MSTLCKNITVAAGLFLFVAPNAMNAAPANQAFRWNGILERRDLQQTALRNAQLPFKVKDWSGVDFFLNEYVQLSPQVWARLSQRMETYLPMIADSMRANGLPESLKFLPVAESRLIPDIVSPAGASGLWQIMKSTGRHCGLKINTQVDERLNPGESTAAAIVLLKKLHTQFGDWLLVLAAYNCGPGKVQKALDQSGCEEYWEIAHLLPAQTQRYIPAYIAAACATTYHMKYIKKGIPAENFIFEGEPSFFQKIPFKNKKTNTAKPVFCWGDPLRALLAARLA